MQRVLLSFTLAFLLTTIVQAQVTQLVPNKGLELVAPLGTGKALLTEANMNTLWVTNGTAAGTFKLADTLVCEGIGGLPNDNYIFAATSPSLGNELWITDGTKEGTKLVKDIYPGNTGAKPQDDFAVLNGFLYFSAAAPGVGREL